MKGWKITKNYLDENVPPQGPTIPNPVKFRLFDDDGELYFEGEIAKDWLDGEEHQAFAPLDWAEQNYGCTEMQYLEEDEWKQL